MHYGRKALAQGIEYLVAAMTVMLCIIVPLYAKDGYNQIGNAKFDVYKAIMMTGGAGLLAVIVIYLIMGHVCSNLFNIDRSVSNFRGIL